MAKQKFERKKEPRPVVQREDRNKEILTTAMKQIMANRTGTTKAYEPIDATPEERANCITTNQYLSFDELYERKSITNYPKSFFHSPQTALSYEETHSAEISSKVSQ